MRKTPPESVAALEALRLRFEGKTALVFGTSPELPKLWNGRSSSLPKWAVKEAWIVVPDADAMYACEQVWWLRPANINVPNECRAPKFGYQTVIPKVYPLHGIWDKIYDDRLGYLSLKAPSNSGNQSVQLVAQLGAKRIVLVGFGMRGGYFFKGHPPRATPWDEFVVRFNELGEELAKRGTELVNATPGSALMLPYVDLDEVLNA